MLRHAFDNSGCGFDGLHAAHGQAVEPDHGARLAANVCLGAVGLLIGQRKPMQKLVERCLPTIKAIQQVRAR